jgi:hypothetical protein
MSSVLLRAPFASVWWYAFITPPCSADAAPLLAYTLRCTSCLVLFATALKDMSALVQIQIMQQIHRLHVAHGWVCKHLSAPYCAEEELSVHWSSGEASSMISTVGAIPCS